jgi:hypothetical protein
LNVIEYSVQEPFRELEGELLRFQAEASPVFRFSVVYTPG